MYGKNAEAFKLLGIAPEIICFTILRPDCHHFGGKPLINHPEFIYPGLTLFKMNKQAMHKMG
jgi:hypothetical protein